MFVDYPFNDPKIASKYDSWYHTSGKKAANQEKSLLSSFLREFGELETILDLGCGTGYFTNWYRTLKFNAAGLDSSIEMLKAARLIYGLNCCQGDAAWLPFDDHSFDLVCMITVLEFAKNPIDILKETLRMTRKGLIIGAVNRHSLLGIRRRCKGGPIWGSARLYSVGELSRLLYQVIDRPARVHYKTTLWPLFKGSIKLPWGGFIGLCIIFT